MHINNYKNIKNKLNKTSFQNFIMIKPIYILKEILWVERDWNDFKNYNVIFDKPNILILIIDISFQNIHYVQLLLTIIVITNKKKLLS